VGATGICTFRGGQHTTQISVGHHGIYLLTFRQEKAISATGVTPYFYGFIPVFLPVLTKAEKPGKALMPKGFSIFIKMSVIYRN
jgi:hypothetical protein